MRLVLFVQKAQLNTNMIVYRRVETYRPPMINALALPPEGKDTSIGKKYRQLNEVRCWAVHNLGKEQSLQGTISAS